MDADVSRIDEVVDDTGGARVQEGRPRHVVVGIEERRRGLSEERPIGVISAVERLPQRHVRAVSSRRQRAERHGHRCVGRHHLPVAPS